MSKVTEQLDNIIRNAGWAKAYDGLDDVKKFKGITGIEWMTDEYMKDLSNEARMLWMIAGGTAYPKIGEGEKERPTVTPNTPEQSKVEQDIIERVNKGQTKIILEEGTVANNITIPETAKGWVTVEGHFQDGFAVRNRSPKQAIVKNVGDPVSVIIESDVAKTLTLRGNYTDVYANVQTVTAYEAQMGSILFSPSLEGKGDLSVSANWTDPVNITSYNTNDLSVDNDSDDKVLEKLDIVAPNATVTASGKWGDVTASVGDDTMILRNGFHANSLNVTKGNVRVENCFYEQCADKITMAPGYTISAREYNVDEIKSLTRRAGIYTINGNVEAGGVFGIVGQGNFKYVNNGKVEVSSKTASLFLRPGINVYIYGDGEWVNNNTEGYGIWKSNDEGVLEIHGGTFRAHGHTVYAEKGFIDIYGGNFYSLSDDKRYLLNVYDANYTNGTAGIRVHGGHFFGFNPAASMSEPNGPVSFLVEGKKSVRVSETEYVVVDENDNTLVPWTETEVPSTGTEDNTAQE